MLCALWSPKGGVGTSVFTAACALVLARHRPVRLVDLDGDQPAILGLPGEPVPGVSEWLGTGPTAPADALDRLAVAVSPGLSLLPYGAHDLHEASPEAGAALGVICSTDERITFADAGRADTPSTRALVEVADAVVVVVRDCYLALRRSVATPLVGRATGAVTTAEEGRGVSNRDIADVLGLPVLATIPVTRATSRAVDAGVFASRMPDGVARTALRLCRGIGVLGAEGRAA